MQFEKLSTILTENVNDVTQEMKDHFDKRTKTHIGMVQDAARQIAEAYPEFEPLLERVKDHDASKFEEPEYTPYLWVNWRYKHTNAGQKFDVPPGIDERMREATAHHVLNNPHHPECSAGECNNDPNDRDKSSKLTDASGMSDLDVAEMVADWQAMSQELKKNTAREWYDKCKTTRWTFAPHQQELIDRLLKVFERK